MLFAMMHGGCFVTVCTVGDENSNTVDVFIVGPIGESCESRTACCNRTSEVCAAACCDHRKFFLQLLLCNASGRHESMARRFKRID